MDASTFVIAIEEADPEWPVRLRFVFLDPDHALGELPHVTMARHLAEHLSIRTLTDDVG